MADKRIEDKNALIECLNIIEAELQKLRKRPDLFRKEFLPDIERGPWEEVLHRFEVARNQIREDQLDWKYIEGVGLTSSPLLWKRDLLKKTARLGVVRRFLSLANSFLGSLTGGLPVVEFIKEYKEFVEACLKLMPLVE